MIMMEMMDVLWMLKLLFSLQILAEGPDGGLWSQT